MSRTICPECNSSTGLAPYDDGEYCHACNSKQHVKSLLANIDSKIETFYKENLLVPSNQNDPWPTEAKKYLKQYYITGEMIRHYTIYWSNTVKRIIIPNDRESSTCAWGRSLTNTPKWIKYGYKKSIVYISGNRRTNELVLVEDCISAIRVAQFTNCLCLSGTSIKDGMSDIISGYKKLIVWLDGDLAGIRGAEKIKREYKLFKDIRIVTCKQDPKELTNSTIQAILNA